MGRFRTCIKNVFLFVNSWFEVQLYTFLGNEWGNPVEKGLDVWFNSNKVLEAKNLANTYQWKGNGSLMDFSWNQEGKHDRQAVKFRVLPLTGYNTVVRTRALNLFWEKQQLSE